MATSIPHPGPRTRTSYAVLRYEGAPPKQARAALELPPQVAERLEQLFLAKRGGRVDPMRPAFADHEGHVDAVLAQGGFPAIGGRGR